MVKEIKNKALRNALEAEGLGWVMLCKDCENGYFFITTEDENHDEIFNIYENAIYLYAFNQQPVSEWVADIKRLLSI